MASAVAIAGPLVWEEDAQGPRAADPAAHGDVVLARKDAPASYHLASTIDDAAMGVTLVVRGADLIAVPAAFTVSTGEAHWHILLRARTSS